MGVHSDVWLGSLVLRARSNRIDLLRFGTRVQLPPMWALHDSFFKLEQVETLRFNLLGYMKITSSRSPSFKSFSSAPSCLPRELQSSYFVIPSSTSIQRTLSDIWLLNRLEEFGYPINSSTHFPVCMVQFGHEFPTRCICIPALNPSGGL